MKKVVGFLCRWCAYRALERLSFKRKRLPEGFFPKVVPCSGTVDLELIHEAICKGASGVFVAGCPKLECKYRYGNAYASAKLEFYRELLRTLGLGSKVVEFAFVSANEDERLYESIWRFWRELR